MPPEDTGRRKMWSRNRQKWVDKSKHHPNRKDREQDRKIRMENMYGRREQI